MGFVSEESSITVSDPAKQAAVAAAADVEPKQSSVLYACTL